MSGCLEIGTPRAAAGAAGGRLAAEVRSPRGRADLWFEVADGAPLSRDATPFVAACLLPAMARGWDVVAEAPLAAGLAAALPTIQDILTSWRADLARVTVTAPPAATAPPPFAAAAPEAAPAAAPAAARTASFFSGGVDSFYTFLRHRAEIGSLVFVAGFDIRLDDGPLRARAAAANRRAAGRLGVRLVEVATNVRAFGEAFAPWDLYHGTALAAVAHALAPRFDTVFIPASHTYADLFPWGSHPLLDPLWSSAALRLVHDGCEATRVAKVARIAECDAALETLRVCWRNPDGAYNCGRCEKCQRTMVNLLVCGALGRCTTFDAPLDVDAIASFRVGGDLSTAAFVEENLRALEARGDNPRLAAALRAALKPPGPLDRWRRRLGRLLAART